MNATAISVDNYRTIDIPYKIAISCPMKWRMLVGVLLALSGMVWLSVPAQAAVTSMMVDPQAGGAEQVTLTTRDQVHPRQIFALTNPDRVVVDLPLTDTVGLALPKDYQGTLIAGLRVGRFDTGTTRLVFDLKAPATMKLVDADDSRVVLMLTPASAAISAASPFAAMESGAKTAAPESPVVPERKKPLIAIDPGHGGKDPGATSGEVQEKELTLAYAKALREALLRTGRYRVVLTRDDDRFLKLGQRVAIARQKKADVFISLHADSNPNKEAHGISFYSLSETASDAEAAALAEQENKSDIIGGIDLGVADEDVASILIDLTQRETMAKSSKFADFLVEALHPKITKLPRVHRYAGFRVLKAPDVPSTLIELGFLSNPKDVRLLQSPEYRGLVVGSLVKGIDSYFAGEKSD